MKQYNSLKKGILKKTELKKRSDKKISQVKNKMSEKFIFDEVYNIHGGKCMLTGREVDKGNPSCYPHYLSKGAYQNLKLNTNNIGLVYNSELHKIVDEIIFDLISLEGRPTVEGYIREGVILEIIKKEYNRKY